LELRHARPNNGNGSMLAGLLQPHNMAAFRNPAFSNQGKLRPISAIRFRTQYTSIAFGLHFREMNVKPSMGSVGDACDNAIAESFFAALACELLDRRRFRSQAEARMAIFEFIESWYKPHRRHSALQYLSPINYERRINVQDAA
jgi:transposase InsO family protein